MSPTIRTWIPVAATGLALSFAPVPGAAQIPGMSGSSARGNQAEYLAEIYETAHAMIASWWQAWEADDLAATAGFYHESAWVILPGHEPLSGRDAVRDALEPLLRSTGSIFTGMTDLDASGRVAYLSGPFRIQRRAAPGEASRGPLEPLTGSYLMVLRRDGEEWRFRAQAFQLDRPAGAVDTVAPGGGAGGSADTLPPGG